MGLGCTSLPSPLAGGVHPSPFSTSRKSRAIISILFLHLILFVLVCFRINHCTSKIIILFGGRVWGGVWKPLHISGLQYHTWPHPLLFKILDQSLHAIFIMKDGWQWYEILWYCWNIYSIIIHNVWPHKGYVEQKFCKC